MNNPVSKTFDMKQFRFNEGYMNSFLAGATSESAKEYWYKQFEKEKLEFAIEQLRKLQYSNETDNLIEELEQKLNKL